MDCTNQTDAAGPLKGNKLKKFSQKLPLGWRIIQEHHLQKEFIFPDFKSALNFTNQVGKIGEQMGHHPDIHLSYGQVLLQIWSHSIDGLSENDFTLAARCDVLFSAY